MLFAYTQHTGHILDTTAPREVEASIPSPWIDKAIDIAATRRPETRKEELAPANDQTEF